jgi:hypothetical protein
MYIQMYIEIKNPCKLLIYRGFLFSTQSGNRTRTTFKVTGF